MFVALPKDEFEYMTHAKKFRELLAKDVLFICCGVHSLNYSTNFFVTNKFIQYSFSDLPRNKISHASGLRLE